ncbi:ABC transporter permease [Methylobacterium organophilum]|uniref:Glutathione transport system permease protein GsiC n=1 Tax=Methylobacterium organophilum TaxID=410 RepID=A0ABQ4TEE7_METOR|nr:ABC transporter permease [Methylobacterium organophilum]GJE28899.1 Glutathione transport system permease protein GsiC [Methylobacterium organophilum]
MTRLLLGRLVQAVLVALVVGGLCFALVRVLPGDGAFRIAADRYGPDALTGQAAEAVRQELGLDRPWPELLLRWFGELARGHLGNSLVSGESVSEELVSQLGPSLWLAACALILSLLIGLPLGLVSGLRAGSGLDRLALIGAVALRALPPFVLGLMLMLVFSIRLEWLPPAGYGTWREMALPSLTLALGLAAVSSRVTRDAVAEVGATTYYRFARLKGLPERAVLVRHGLRNAAIPVVTYLGLQAVYLIEGVVVVESLFAYPGIGHALVHAVIARDVPMVQGAALVMGLMFVLLNLGVDLLCRLLDPRLGAAR